MRIIGHIPHPRLHVTVFKWDERLAVKVARDLLELTWKFRDGQFERFEDLQQALDQDFFREAERLLDTMAALRHRISATEAREDLPDLL